MVKISQKQQYPKRLHFLRKLLVLKIKDRRQIFKKKINKIHFPSVLKAQDFSEGCFTLCSILSIDDEKIFVELPCGNHGILLLTEINTPFLERIQEATNNQEEDLPSLEDFFSVGQFLSAVVISSGTRPVDISIKPELLNDGINLDIGSVFAGAVKSIEDHGYIIDIGRKGITAFLPYITERPKSPNFSKGQPIYVSITKQVSSNNFQVELFNQDQFFPSNPLKKAVFDQFRPTSILNSVVLSNEKSGILTLQISGTFDAICSKYSWPAGLSKGDSVPVRPIFIDRAQKKLWVSAIDSIVHGENPHCVDISIGTTYSSYVVRIRSGIGIECSNIPDTNNNNNDINNENDINNSENEQLNEENDISEKLNEEDDSSEKLKEIPQRIFIDIKETKSDVAIAAGDKHNVRIIAKRMIDDLLIATDDPEILRFHIFSSKDVEIGQVYPVTVQYVHPRHGVFVKLSKFFTALCPLNYADKPESLKKRDELKAIILSKDENLVRVALQTKFIETIESKEFPIIKTIEDAQEVLKSRSYVPCLILSVYPH